jgi:hypothetical protein
MVSIRQRTIKYLKQMGATWGRLSLPVKVIGLITIATVIDVALRNTQLWSLIPWQLVFGLLIGVLIFSYKKMPSWPLSQDDTSLDVTQKSLDKITAELVHGIQNIYQESPSQTIPPNVTKTETTKDAINHALNRVQQQVNTVLETKKEANEDSASHTTQDPDLLPGIPVIVTNDQAIYILKNRTLTLKQEHQFNQHIHSIQTQNKGIRIVVLIGKNIQNHIVHISFKDQATGLSEIEMPLNFMSLN